MSETKEQDNEKNRIIQKTFPNKNELKIKKVSKNKIAIIVGVK